MPTSRLMIIALHSCHVIIEYKNQCGFQGFLDVCVIVYALDFAISINVALFKYWQDLAIMFNVLSQVESVRILQVSWNCKSVHAFVPSLQGIQFVGSCITQIQRLWELELSIHATLSCKVRERFMHFNDFGLCVCLLNVTLQGPRRREYLCPLSQNLQKSKLCMIHTPYNP